MQESISLRSITVLSAIGLLIFLINIDYTAVNLALLPISREIESNLAMIQWLLSAYVLAWTIAVIPAGNLADTYGKLYSLVIGILCFILGSGLCGFGHCIEVIILGRVLQGLAAALFIPPAFASIYLFTPHDKQGLVMGIVMSCGGLGLAAGPTIAGFIIDNLNWRWIFYLNLPLCLIILSLFLMYFPRQEKPKNHAKKVDVVGIFLLMFGLGIIMIMLNRLGSSELRNISSWLLTFLGFFLLGFCILRDYLIKGGLFPTDLFSNKQFISAILGRSLMAMNLSLILFLMSLFLQNILCYSSREVGIIFVTMTLTMGIISPIGGKITDLFGVRSPMILGACVALLATAAMAKFNEHTPLMRVIFVLILAGIGLQASFSANNLFVMRSVSKEDLSVASAIYSMFAMLGSTLGVVVPTSVLIGFGQTRLNDFLTSSPFQLTPHQHQELLNLLATVTPLTNKVAGFDSNNIPLILNWLKAAFVFGFSSNMVMSSSLSFLAAILAFWGTRSCKSVFRTIEPFIIGGKNKTMRVRTSK